MALLVPRLIRLHFPKVVGEVRGTERDVTNVTFVLRCAWNIVVGIFLKGVGQLTSAIVTLSEAMKRVFVPAKCVSICLLNF